MSDSNTDSTCNKPCIELLVPSPLAICNAWWDNPNNVRISGRHLLTNSKGKTFSSHIEFTPNSLVVQGDNTIVESRNSFYQLMVDPDYDPKTRHKEKHRYLPPLRSVKVVKVEYTDLITGFDEGCNDTIEAELVSETEDYFEVYHKAWSKRSGLVRYLK